MFPCLSLHLRIRSLDFATAVHGSVADLVLQANRKLEEIYRSIVKTTTDDVLTVRTRHTVTFVSDLPVRHIQVILRLYTSPAEILMGYENLVV